ncbi:MAG: flagellar hook basal-body protein [Rhodocyclaceae bacterium]
MNDVYAIVASALSQDASALRSVSQNVSNLSTPGYKREVAYQPAFGTLVARGVTAIDTTRAMDAPGRITSSPARVFDATVGTLKKTGRALDVAIAGDGYFEVMLEDGPAYTRQGNFRIDPQGRLVTDRGEPVMGQGGEIVLTTEAISIGTDGEVRDGDRTVGYLKLVQPGDISHAEHIAPGVIRSAAPAESVDTAKVRLQQGYLENANVSLASEMVQMMQTMRHFESVQRVAQQFDDLMGNAIRKLGEA